MANKKVAGCFGMRGGSNIRMVTFDLWETLLLERDGWNSKRTLIRCRNLAKVLDKFGAKISMEQLHTAMKAMTPWLVEIWEKDRDVTHLDQLQFLASAASKGLVPLKEEWFDELSSAYVSPVFEVPPYLNPDTSKVFQWLKKKNKRIGLICNSGHTPGFVLRQILKKEGIADYFDLMLFSDEAGIRKPDPRIFLMAAEEVNVAPHEVVHVGDNLKSDVWGAKNAGFKAVHLKSETGRDKVAESDPSSLVSISRTLVSINEKENAPDRTIASLGTVIEAIESLENR